MEVEVHLFGPYREAVGRKTLTTELADGATVETLFRELGAEYEGLAERVLTDDGELTDSVTVTKNGKSVTLLDGAATPLEDGDVVRAAPPVHGGHS